MRFRERHQDPNSTDIEYAARINGYSSVDDFIAAHSGSPWFVSMVGFVAGPAVPVSDGRAREADRGAEISAAAHRHAEAHGRPWRLLRLHLLGARRRRLSDVRHHPGADLRSRRRGCPISRTSWCSSAPATSSNGSRSRARNTTATSKAVEAGTFDLTHAPGEVLAEGVSRRSRRLQPTSSWRCSMAIEVIKPGLATTVQDAGRPGLLQRRHSALGRARPVLPCALPICWSATTRARRCWKRRCSGPSSLFRQAAIVAVTGAETAPKLNGKPRAAQRSLRGQAPARRLASIS